MLNMFIKKMNPIIISTLLCALFIFGCSDDEDPIVEEADPCLNVECQNGGECDNGTCNCPEGFEGEFCENEVIELLDLQLKKIVFEDKIEEYTYFEDNKVMQRTVTILDSGNVLVEPYEYVGDTVKLTSGIGDNISKEIKYYPISETISYRDETFLASGNMSRNIYEFSEDKCSLLKIEVESTGQTVEYEYLDDNCSYTATNKTAEGLVTSSSTIMKDDSNLYHRSYQHDIFKGKEGGNIIAGNFFDENGDQSSSYTVEYEFNEHNYPTKRTTTSDSGNVSVVTFEYY